MSTDVSRPLFWGYPGFLSIIDFSDRLVFFQDKSLGDCSSCRFWYQSPISDEVYKGVIVHDPPMNLAGFFDGLGECRRTPPSAYVTICASTEKQEAKHNKALNTRGEELLKAKEEWDKRREDELRVAEVRLENIRESLKTCRETSTAHWKAELAKQEEKIERQRQEFFDFDFWDSRHLEPELKTFKALKGVWPLTASDEFCGEWQQR